VNVGGGVTAGFEYVREVFGEVLVEQRGTGAAVAIWRDGDWVVDLWGGWADTRRSRRWQADSIVQPYSVSKPFVACCALMLVDRGLLELDAPVQRYWPELRTPTTVRQVLSHQSGIVALDQPAPVDVFFDWNRMCELLAVQEPAWQPGTRLGESALFYGHLVGELVHRIDGRLPGAFLREEICGPLGLDFQFGLPVAEQERTVELSCFDDLRDRMRADHPAEALYWRAMTNPPGCDDPEVVNSARWRAAEIPAINGHGTARATAGLFVALEREAILSRNLLTEARRTQCSGIDAVFNQPSAWGLGFGVDADYYGMGGLGGSYAGFDAGGNYAIGFVTGTLGDHERMERIENAFREIIGCPPLS
jgi:CubicO group peptidase (beta-lactamase class C family)